MTRDHDPRYRPAADPYADTRCEQCLHLIYQDEPDSGSSCRWCDCAEHRRPT